MAAHWNSPPAATTTCHAAPHLQPPLVCCIALLCRLVPTPHRSSPANQELRQIVRLIRTTTFAYATREGVARRAWLDRKAGMAALPPDEERPVMPNSTASGVEPQDVLGHPLGRGDGPFATPGTPHTELLLQPEDGWWALSGGTAAASSGLEARAP